MRYTINSIDSEMTNNGSHWWDRDSMAFFNCRVGQQVYQGPGGIYFVSSERGTMGPRMYSVRQYFPAVKGLDTVGEFCSMSRPYANGMAKRLAATSLQVQFDDAMCDLDLAVTGENKSGRDTKYGSIDVARECGSASILYLSDGGYTRVAVKSYDDTKSYWLQVLPTFADESANDVVYKNFSKCFGLQGEVCRILKTEPAGESLDVSTDIHIETTVPQQLAIDIVRGGGRCSIRAASDLLRYAKRHQKLMVDGCNGIEVYDKDGEPKSFLRRVRASLTGVAEKCQCGVLFSGDPRGCTVKLTLPSGGTNDWGKSGWCIPTN